MDLASSRAPISLDPSPMIKIGPRLACYCGKVTCVGLLWSVPAAPSKWTVALRIRSCSRDLLLWVCRSGERDCRCLACLGGGREWGSRFYGIRQKGTHQPLHQKDSTYGFRTTIYWCISGDFNSTGQDETAHGHVAYPVKGTASKGAQNSSYCPGNERCAVKYWLFKRGSYISVTNITRTN